MTQQPPSEQAPALSHSDDIESFIAGLTAEAPAPAPAPPADPPAPADTDRGHVRLLEREIALRERESAAERRERELADRLDAKGIRAGIESDPIKFFESLGLDPAQVSRMVIASKLGDDTPEPIRKELAGWETKRELAALRQELAAMRAESESRIRDAEVAKGTSSYVEKLAGNSQYPALAAVAAANPEMVKSAIKERAMAAGTATPDFDAAAKALNEQWSVFQKAFSASPNVQAPAQTAPQGAPPRQRTDEPTLDEMIAEAIRLGSQG